MGADIKGEAADDRVFHRVFGWHACGVGVLNNDGTGLNAGHVRVYSEAAGRDGWAQRACGRPFRY